MKNRVHVDFRCEDRAAEVDRLVALGATVQAERCLGVALHNARIDAEIRAVLDRASWGPRLTTGPRAIARQVGLTAPVLRGKLDTVMSHVTDESPGTTFLFDEDCGLCVGAAAWLGRRVAPRRLRLLPLAQAASDREVGPHVRGRDLAATLHVVTPDGRVRTGARAMLTAGRLVPRWRLLARLFDHRVGHVVLEPFYRRVARHRSAIGRRLGLPASCPMPTADQRPG